MENKTLNVLVVDDDQRNLEAAKSYFSTRKGLSVDYSTNFNDAAKKLEEKVYAYALFDLQLPVSTGGVPHEANGEHLATIATRQNLDWALVTTGTDHHHKVSAFVRYVWDDTPKFHEITETPKNIPEAWMKIFENLEKFTANMHEIIAAKERYKKFVGRMYDRGGQTP